MLLTNLIKGKDFPMSCDPFNLTLHANPATYQNNDMIKYIV